MSEGSAPETPTATHKPEGGHRINNRVIRFRADDNLFKKLCTFSEKTGQSKSSLLRLLIDGGVLREMPPMDYHAMTAELHAIGNNMNQIARAANATGNIDRELYTKCVAALEKAVSEIILAVLTR